ncbi:conjugal transfer protein TraF [Helicobacter macacae]|uniref:Uncharacterized protein n=1 Tax=Helicobacter macacae MIT 99-5501 TaxID=1357400 RepID=V8CA08_9HELI|nr:conjugal transfer protein TraF [Helicobacter macacae]ETD23922.1 hypothetical protein HMPREF2086_00668 [Helicobacter macacae MIT 99-5501]
MKHNKLNKILRQITKSKKVKSSALLLAPALLANALFALEFGGVGNVSAGMGGAGVALKQSQWTLYYNPALLGIVNKSSFGYSFGAEYKETNLLAATNIDKNNIEEMYKELDGLFKGTATNNGRGGDSQPVVLSGRSATPQNVSPQANSKNLQLNGVFGDVVRNLLGKGSSDTVTDSDLTEYLKKHGGGDNPSSVDDALKKMSSSDFEGVKKDLEAAIKKTEDTHPDSGLGILAGIVSGLTPENLKKALEQVGSGDNIDITKLLGKMGGITLKAGSSSTLNTFLKDMQTINGIIAQNDLNVSTQNGLIITYSGKDNNWGISLGLLASAYANAHADIDKTHNQIIIKSGSDYYGISVGSGGVTIDKSDDTKYNASSILTGNHHITSNAIAFGELPIGYGYAWHSRAGTFGLGLAGKYIHAAGYILEASGSYDSIGKSISFSSKDIVQTSTWGVDVGLVYVPTFSKNLIFGLVGKNLNAPKIKTNKKTIELNRQVRAGVSYSLWKERIVFALDADLLANQTLSTVRPYSQMIGGGVMFDFKYVDLRFGSMYDFRDTTKEGVILTGGINILGFLDIAVQSNLNLTSIPQISKNLQLPSYLNVKIGGGFSW